MQRFRVLNCKLLWLVNGLMNLKYGCSLIVLVVHIIKNYAEVFALSYGDTELQQEHVLPELDSWLSQVAG